MPIANQLLDGVSLVENIKNEPKPLEQRSYIQSFSRLTAVTQQCYRSTASMV